MSRADRGPGTRGTAARSVARAAPCLEVEDPGLLATIQDRGRPGLGALGVPAGGAADPEALAVANALLGNDPGAAVVELTLPGARLRALRPVTLAVAGSDLGARVTGGPAVAPGSTVVLPAGAVLAFEGAAAAGSAGCRAVVALPGGVAVPMVLGSRSTAVAAGFGGLDGRPLRPGDRLRAGDATLARVPGRWTGPVADPLDGPIHVLPGPGGPGPGTGGAGPLGPALEGLLGRDWTVSQASDRMGLRLAGDPLPGGSGTLASHGVLAGAVQLPPDGLPIVLLPDAQPTGGYPVVAVVATVDRPRLGQLAPGMTVRFARVDEAAARAMAAVRRRAIDGALEALRDAQQWDALWRGAGA